MRGVLFSQRADSLGWLHAHPCFQKVKVAGGCQKVSTPVDAGQPQEAASWNKEALQALLMGSYVGDHLRGNSLLLVEISIVLLFCLWGFAFA